MWPWVLGLVPEAVQFFKGLQADNTKACWGAQGVLRDLGAEFMAALPDELSGEVGPGRIARPYLDVWFQAGKSPYKTARAAPHAGGPIAGVTSTTGVPSIAFRASI
jgi:hypothetical protein